MTRATLALALSLLSLAAPAAARDILFAQPIDCTLGQDCYIQQFVDLDPGPGARDFTCGPLSYDGHKGTDFGLPTQRDLADGVNVLAAAPGTVRAIRDEMPDVLYSDETAAMVEGRDCGNGVLITHGDGWETQYCHLKRGSVTVAPGDRVAMGAVLGQVGLSGRTQFPHLHLSVRKDGAVIDPFDPDGQVTCGAPSAETLWLDPPAYRAGGLLSLGFAAAVPDYAEVKAGTAAADRLSPTDPALVLFGLAFGARQGDVMEISITGPEGEVITNRAEIERTQAQLFRAAGRRTPDGGWPRGRYDGRVALVRDGAVIDRRETTIDIR